MTRVGLLALKFTVWLFLAGYFVGRNEASSLNVTTILTSTTQPTSSTVVLPSTMSTTYVFPSTQISSLTSDIISSSKAEQSSTALTTTVFLFQASSTSNIPTGLPSASPIFSTRSSSAPAATSSTPTTPTVAGATTAFTAAPTPIANVTTSTETVTTTKTMALSTAAKTTMTTAVASLSPSSLTIESASSIAPTVTLTTVATRTTPETTSNVATAKTTIVTKTTVATTTVKPAATATTAATTTAAAVSTTAAATTSPIPATTASSIATTLATTAASSIATTSPTTASTTAATSATATKATTRTPLSTTPSSSPSKVTTTTKSVPSKPSSSSTPKRRTTSTTIIPSRTTTSIVSSTGVPSSEKPIIFKVKAKIEKDWNAKYAYPYTEEYKRLKKELEEALILVLKILPGFLDVEILSFSKGSVQFDFNVFFAENSSVNKDSLTKTIESVKDGPLKGVKVEAVEKPGEEKTTPKPKEKMELWLIVVIVAAAVFVIYSVILVVLLIKFRRLKRTKRSLSTSKSTSSHIGDDDTTFFNMQLIRAHTENDISPSETFSWKRDDRKKETAELQTFAVNENFQGSKGDGLDNRDRGNVLSENGTRDKGDTKPESNDTASEDEQNDKKEGEAMDVVIENKTANDNEIVSPFY